MKRDVNLVRAILFHQMAVLHEHPLPMTHAFSGDSRKLGQWRSFFAQDQLLVDEPDLYTVIHQVGDFIMFAVRAAIVDRRAPWRPAR